MFRNLVVSLKDAIKVLGGAAMPFDGLTEGGFSFTFTWLYQDSVPHGCSIEGFTSLVAADRGLPLLFATWASSFVSSQQNSWLSSKEVSKKGVSKMKFSLSVA